MSGSYRCFGTPGTQFCSCSYQEDDYVAPDGQVEMIEPLPTWPYPDRFGEWRVTQAGTFQWVKLPDPPFPVVYHEGKLKNGDTLLEIAIETLPGDIAARLAALEASILPPSP